VTRNTIACYSRVHGIYKLTHALPFLLTGCTGGGLAAPLWFTWNRHFNLRHCLRRSQRPQEWFSNASIHIQKLQGRRLEHRVVGVLLGKMAIFNSPHSQKSRRNIWAKRVRSLLGNMQWEHVESLPSLQVNKGTSHSKLWVWMDVLSIRFASVFWGSQQDCPSRLGHGQTP
jgi:hypothetical protein